MLCTGNCSVEFQSGLSVPRLRIWVIQPNEWCKVGLDMFLPTSHCSSLSLDSARHLNCGTGMAGEELIRKQLQVVNRQCNWFFVDFCAKVSAEILCNNFSHEVPSMVQTDDCWSNGVRTRFERMLKEQYFFQRPRLVAGLKKDRTQSLQVRDFGMKRRTLGFKVAKLYWSKTWGGTWNWSLRCSQTSILNTK